MLPLFSPSLVRPLLRLLRGTARRESVTTTSRLRCLRTDGPSSPCLPSYIMMKPGCLPEPPRGRKLLVLQLMSCKREMSMTEPSHTDLGLCWLPQSDLSIFHKQPLPCHCHSTVWEAWGLASIITQHSGSTELVAQERRTRTTKCLEKRVSVL